MPVDRLSAHGVYILGCSEGLLAQFDYSDKKAILRVNEEVEVSF